MNELPVQNSTAAATQGTSRTPVAPEAAAGKARPSSFRLGGLDARTLLLRYSTLLVLCLLFAGFALFVDRFLTVRNLVNITQQISMLTIVGVGLTFGFALREMDLSVGYTASLSGLAVPLLLVAGYSVPTAVAVGLALGVIVGLVNSVIVTLIGVPSLITTIATGSILAGVNFLLSRGRAVYGGMPESYLEMGQGAVGVVPRVSLFMLGFVLLAWFIMEKTFLGRYLYALGGNARAAELAGIPPRRYKAVGLVLCAVFAAAAGILLSARLGSGQPGAGERYLLDGLGTVFIGMTMLRPGTATVLGTFFGALFIGVVDNGLNLIGMDTSVQQIFKGAIIIGSISIISRQTTLRLV